MSEDKPLASMTKAELIERAKAAAARIAELEAAVTQTAASAPVVDDEVRVVTINGHEYTWRAGDEASVPPQAVLLWEEHLMANPSLRVKTRST